MARPAQFERDDVLDRAMHAFWDHGYYATSMASLVDATQLNPGSIYAAFKSKEGLFLAALDHYGQCSIAGIRRTLDEADTPLNGIRAVVRQAAVAATQPGATRSCLLVNTALEVARRNPDVRVSVKHHLDVIETLLREALEDAQESGELVPDQEPHALATFLMTNLWGLRVLGSMESDLERARSVVNQIMRLLDQR